MDTGPSELAPAVALAGGVGAPAAQVAELRRRLGLALARGEAELGRARSGREAPVEAAVAAGAEALVAVLPLPAAARADPHAAPARAWELAAAVVAALVDLVAPPPPARGDDLRLAAGEWSGHLSVALPVAGFASADLEALAPLAFAERAEGIDRLRARLVPVGAEVLADGGLDDLRAPIGAEHPLRVAEGIARLGGDPADPRSVDLHEERVLALLGADGAAGPARPHEDADPSRRVARRILQRLAGMGKWGGFHTEFAHLARGFPTHERDRAQAVAEALLAAGLLAEKPSVGQRHVFLDPRRAGEIHALIERGELPASLSLPE